VLGYKGSSSIRSRFPGICSAIITKRQQQSLQKKEQMRRAHAVLALSGVYATHSKWMQEEFGIAAALSSQFWV
jgi:hypothetical protein